MIVVPARPSLPPLYSPSCCRVARTVCVTRSVQRFHPPALVASSMACIMVVDQRHPQRRAQACACGGSWRAHSMGMAAQLAAVSCAMLGGRQEAYGNRGIVCYWWVVMLVRLHRNGTLGEMCATACQATK